MRIMCVDADAAALARMADIAGALAPAAEVLRCAGSLEALAEARAREVDVAFIEPDLPELNGLDLGRYMKELYPLVNLIYTSEKQDCCPGALALHASGFLSKPVTQADAGRELADLRHPAAQKRHKRVFAQTFGSFELFVDDKPVAFKYSRTKEIVALLVNNRGAQTTNGEIIGALWEDDGDPEKRGSYLSNLRQDLQNTLSRLNVTDIINKQRGSLAIAVDRIRCDLYEWLKKRDKSGYRYLGDYMNQYSWAEYMHAELDEISYAMED
ncbi:MAG: response regulator [Clostridia bacterium]|nr:response regulator [Clostridia bacterium]